MVSMVRQKSAVNEETHCAQWCDNRGNDNNRKDLQARGRERLHVYIMLLLNH